MANKFNIIITATDRGTAVVRKFKDNLSQITRPVRQTFASFKRFSKEVGLDKLGRGFVNVAKFAGSAALKIGGVGLAMAGVAAIAGAAELANWARDWLFTGSAVQRFASITGQSTQRIQSLTAAGVLFGLEADAMKSALQGVGDTFEDAITGRNYDAMAMMRRLGITMKLTKDGSVDAAAAIMDVSKAISSMKPFKGYGLAQSQGQVARSFGLEGILPLLQKGPKEIERLEKLVAATNALLDPGALKNMQAYQQDISLLTLSITGLGNALASRLLPNLTPATRGLTEFIEKISLAIAKHQEGMLIDWGAQTLGLKDKPSDKPGGKPKPAAISWNHKGEPLESWWTFLDEVFGKRGAYNNGLSERDARSALQRMFPGVTVTSGGRTPQHNREVGGKPNSYHLKDAALDFLRPRGQNIASIRMALRAAGVPITELLDEGDHIHWAWGRRNAGRNSGAGSLLSAAVAAGAGARAAPPIDNMALPTPKMPEIVVRFANAPPGLRMASPDHPIVKLKIDYAMPELAAP